MVQTAFKLIFKDLGYKTVSAGGSQSWEWNSDDEYILKHVLVIERDDLSLSKCLLTGRIEQNYWTFDRVPASIFGRDIRTAWELNYELPKNQKVYISIENTDTSDHDIQIVLVLERKG